MERMKINFKHIILAGAIGIVLVLMADFNNRVAAVNRLAQQREVVAAQATDLMAAQITLQARIEYATSEAAVEEWAYEEGRMVRPGDQLVVPLPVGEALPAPTPAAAAAAPPLENWQVWLAVFFDAP